MKGIPRRIMKVLYYCFFTLVAYLKTKILKYEDNPESLVKFAFSNWGPVLRIQQVKEEIFELLKILGEKKPKVLLEIGTARGGSLFLFSRMAPDGACLISVDLPGGKFGGGYFGFVKILFYSFIKDRQKLFLIRGNSHEQDTVDRVEKILDGRKLDFLFIDGDHTYEGVKRDFELYSRLVKEKGVIAMHDIAEHGSRDVDVKVNLFWNEIKQKCDCREIIKDRKQGWAGIGVLFE